MRLRQMLCFASLAVAAATAGAQERRFVIDDLELNLTWETVHPRYKQACRPSQYGGSVCGGRVEIAQTPVMLILWFRDNLLEGFDGTFPRANYMAVKEELLRLLGPPTDKRPGELAWAAFPVVRGGKLTNEFSLYEAANRRSTVDARTLSGSTLALFQARAYNYLNGIIDGTRIPTAPPGAPATQAAASPVRP